MTGSDSKQPNCRSFRPPSTLLPVSQGVDADTHRLRELRLGQANEAAKRSDVITGFYVTIDETSADPSGNSPRHLFDRKFWDLRHGTVPPT